MRRFILPIFIIVPILEIYLLITVGGVIGVLPTILLIFITAIVGVTLLRQQGMATLQRVQLALSRGEMPTEIMLEGVVLIICGAFLLTPGFFTDTLGFLGLVPLLRQRLTQAVVQRLNLNFFTAPGSHHQRSEQSRDGAIEGEFWQEEDR